MKILNNCDELIQFMYEELSQYPLNKIMFQGDFLDVIRIGVQYPSYVVGDLFISEREIDNYFFFQLVKVTCIPRNTPTVMVPNYVKDELIATLKGEW